MAFNSFIEPVEGFQGIAQIGQHGGVIGGADGRFFKQLDRALGPAAATRQDSEQVQRATMARLPADNLVAKRLGLLYLTRGKQDPGIG